MKIISWSIFIGSICVTIVAHITGLVNSVVYVSILSEVALIFAGFLAVRANSTPREVVNEIISVTEINEQK